MLLEQHVAWYFVSNYLFVPKSLHQLSCLSDITPTPNPVDMKQTQIHKYMWAHERVRSMPIPATISAGVHLMILHRGGGWTLYPPTSLIWLMTSVLARSDLMGGSEMNSQLCDRSHVFGGQRSRQAPEELPVVSCGGCLAILKSKPRATVQHGDYTWHHSSESANSSPGGGKPQRCQQLKELDTNLLTSLLLCSMQVDEARRNFTFMRTGIYGASPKSRSLQQCLFALELFSLMTFLG